MLYPFLFRPLLKERVWGGGNIARLYHKSNSVPQPIGESWEICDRPEDQSQVLNGPLAGSTLRLLMEKHGPELLGRAKPWKSFFPLLIKILDAQETLSLQVHPPAELAERLGGEPKTEMWYVTSAEPGAQLYVGLKAGLTRAEFERKLKEGTVAECFHQAPVRAGDAMFVPSGRVHAIGKGCVLFEVQQNSDTTYRVFDWNRMGLDGRPRPLHIPESMQCIDFNDFEPGLIQAAREELKPGIFRRVLVRHSLFSIDEFEFEPHRSLSVSGDAVRIVGVVEGQFNVRSNRPLQMGPGSFCLIPACISEAVLEPQHKAKALLIEAH